MTIQCPVHSQLRVQAMNTAELNRTIPSSTKYVRVIGSDAGVQESLVLECHHDGNPEVDSVVCVTKKVLSEWCGAGSKPKWVFIKHKC